MSKSLRKRRSGRISPIVKNGTVKRYENLLEQIAKQVGKVITNHYDGSNYSVEKIKRILTKYSDDLSGWAEEKAISVLNEVNRADLAMWRKNSQHMSKGIFNLIKNSPVGHIAKAMVEQQIKYMKSLPLEAAIRVADIHQKAFEITSTGGRSKELFNEIIKSGDVAASRARLIARTEISRAATAMTQSRAMSIGSEGYIWRTAMDSDVRDSHALMEGKFVRWDSPPTLDGMTGHAGTLPNDRCYPEVVIPDYYLEAA